MPAPSPRRLAGAGGTAAVVLALACGCSGTPAPAGDPVPGPFARKNHFRYEEGKLLAVLETLTLYADPAQVLAPL